MGAIFKCSAATYVLQRLHLVNSTRETDSSIYGAFSLLAAAAMLADMTLATLGLFGNKCGYEW